MAPQIQDDDRYEALARGGDEQGEGGPDRQHASREMKDKGAPGAYEDWTAEQLYEKAKEVGVEGRSGMSKPS